MAIEKRGNSHRVRIFHNGGIIRSASFTDPEEAKRFKQIEKAKLLLSVSPPKRLSEGIAMADKRQYTASKRSLRRFDAQQALCSTSDPVARAAAQAEIEAIDIERLRASGLENLAKELFTRPQSDADQRTVSTLTLGDIVRRTLSQLPKRQHGLKLQDHYALLAFLKLPLCDKLAVKARKADFQKFRDQRLRQVSPASVKRELGRWHAMIEVARDEWGLDIPENPAAVRHPKGADAFRDRRLDKQADEESKLLALPELLRDATVIAIDTAMRQGEILKLRPSHLKPQYLKLTANMTKTRKPRDVPLLTERVREVLARRAAAAKDNKRLFEIGSNAFKMRWVRAVRSLGIKNLRFHDLRHEATSRLFELKQFNDVEIMAITGHESLLMLKRYHKADAEELASRVIRDAATHEREEKENR